MCGLSAILMRDPSLRADAALAGRMASTMFHRGPDGGRAWAEGPIALGHRRLKIIDLSERGAQPMTTPDGRFVIVYNGEIYNYRELRGELEGRGVRCVGHSDTEVLLHLYARQGDAMLARLNGIFSMVIWDRVERRLFAARDHLGVKPLYYAIDKDRITFASEIKAITAAGFTAALDPSRVGELLGFGSTAGEATLFRGVKRLLPGHFLEVRPNGDAPRIVRFFDVDDVDAAPRGAADRLVLDALSTAVARQMVSDVPVGSMCSGGVDSSFITALSARIHAGISTFSIKLSTPRFDESAQAALVARHCGTKHHLLESTPADVADLLPTAIWMHDEPLAHPNSVPIFQISRLARGEVTVLLSGEGADELFAGYSTYRRALALTRVRSVLPPFAMRVLEPIARRSKRRAIGQLFDAAIAADPAGLLLALASKADEAALRSLAPDVILDVEERRAIADRSWRAAKGDPVLAALLHDQQTHLRTLLDRQDKMCMGASIESRVPVLDVDVVKLANALPTRSKVDWRDDKIALREAARGALPESIRARPKWAFGLPLASWFAGSESFARIVSDLHDGELVRAGVLSRAGVAKLVDDVRANRSAYPDLLFYAVNLELWHRLYVTKTLEPNRAELPAWRDAPGGAETAVTALSATPS